MSKLSEFHVGVLDLFGILLPGAIAKAILAPSFDTLMVERVVASPTTPLGGWIGFVVCAYFFGHLIFLAGAYLDHLYDLLRKRLDPYGNDSAYQCAKQIRNKLLVEENERKALSTFQWARSVLVITCPNAAGDVGRLEADSKFFRSLIVVCALAGIVFFATERPISGILASFLIVPCFARYYERRLKSTTQAYTHVVSMFRLDKFQLRSNENET